MKHKQRCEWTGDNVLYQKYHDKEWGVPSYDDQHLFEMLILEGAQAGLSWITVLKKRAAYRKAFDQFNAEKMARYSDKKIEKLLLNPGIIRNRLKINSARSNARCCLAVTEEFGCFSDYIWRFVNGEPKKNTWKKLTDIPVTTKQSDAMCKDLKKRGFKFIGSTICYAYMQAVGMVNDHVMDCFRHKQINNK
jgi:DNA-3-methyladenine glycosylase I